MLKSVDELMTKVDRLVDERICQEKVQPADAEEERKTRTATILNAKAIFDGAVDLLVRGDAFVYEVDGKLRFITMVSTFIHMYSFGHFYLHSLKRFDSITTPTTSFACSARS